MNLNNSIATIAAWLKIQLHADHVSAHADQGHGFILFRIESGDPHNVREFTISDEALADHPSATIIADLIAQDVGARLIQDSTMRLVYTTDRIVPHFEVRLLAHGGRTYRIVRGTAHDI